MWNFTFFFNNALLGVGLAMDAFSVSLANGLNEPCMRKRKTCAVAGVFALFQTAMPLLGWIFVHTLLQSFQVFEKFIPWIALVLLLFIGGKMLVEGIQNKEDDPCQKTGVGVGGLLVQGVATSIDALSVGFTIAEYKTLQAIVASVLIGGITFWICLLGLFLGKKFGTKLSNKATVFGGVLLIFIGLEIFITSFL